MSATTATKLKGLQTTLQRLRADLQVVTERARDANRDYDRVVRRVQETEAKIEALSTPKTEPVVSEHALLRYMEREMGMDLDMVRGEILGEGRGAAILAMGSGTLPLHRGSRIVVKGGVVVTVIGEGS